MSTLTVRRAERPDVSGVARSLASAFYDDPVCRFAWPNDAKRLARSGRSFASQLGALWSRREVYTDPDASAVAVWARPDEWDHLRGRVGRGLQLGEVVARGSDGRRPA